MPNTGYTDLPVSSVMVEGPIDVIVVDPDISGPYTVQNIFSQALAVAGGSTQTVVSYTVPSGYKSFLVRAQFGGQNIATYSLLKNSATFDMRRTYYGGGLSQSLEYTCPPRAGYQLNAGDTIAIQVNNFESSVADFEGSIYIIQVSLA